MEGTFPEKSSLPSTTSAGVAITPYSMIATISSTFSTSASMFPCITAACVLQLADEGKLTHGDSLHKWLPAFPYVNPNITIRQLLRHQSGLFDVITNPAFDAASKVKLDSIWSLSNLVRDYIKAPLFAPVASWSYSNTNYALLGFIVDSATGNTYYEEYKRRLFDPLNLGSLFIPPYDPHPSKVAHVWLDGNGDGITEHVPVFFSKCRSFSPPPGPIGAYCATSKDLPAWHPAFFRANLLSTPRYGLFLSGHQHMGYR